MDDNEYLARLDKYNTQTEGRKQHDKHEYFRDEYSEQEYEWPDYLDYCEQWRNDFSTQAKRHLPGFIAELGKRKQRIECGNHHHEFRYLDPLEDLDRTTIDGPVISISHTTYIPFSTCWYQTILHQIETIDTDVKNHWVAPALPNTMIMVFRTLISSHIAASGGDYEIVPYDVFTSGQWHTGSKHALELLKQNPDRTVRSLLDVMENNRESGEDHRLDVMGAEVNKQQILLAPIEIYNDHGFHTFIKASQNPSRWFNFINGIRRRAHAFQTTDTLRMAEYRKAERCEQCTSRPGKRAYSVPGIYYAPPGNGKSTAMKQDEFVGFDTDWLTSCLKWSELTALFYENVPIITNQHSIFAQSGTLMCGIFNDGHVRKRPDGRDYTLWSEILSSKTANPGMIIFHEQTPWHLNRDMPRLMFLHYVREKALEKFMLKRKPNIPEYWKVRVIKKTEPIFIAGRERQQPYETVNDQNNAG